MTRTTSRERPRRRDTACTVEAATPSAQPITCGSSQARRIACSIAAGFSFGERCGRLDRS
jgi:hypothetical protein